MHLAIQAAHLPGDVRGIGRYVRAVLPRMMNLRPDMRVTLFVKNSANVAAKERMVVAMGLPPERVSIARLRTLRRAQADVVWYPWNIVDTMPRSGRIAVTIHDVAPLVFQDQRWWRFTKNRSKRQRYERTARRADLVLTVSEFSASEIVSHLGVPRDHIRVTVLAADDTIAPCSADLRALARLGVRPPFILAVGAGERRKNLETLEAAMAKVAEKRPDLLLVLAGPRRKAVPDPSYQRTLGFVADADLVSLYAAAETLVMPSLYEGFGLPLLEAMRCGLPVICARTSSLPEVAGDAAFWVDAQDVDGFANAILKVTGDESLRGEMRMAGYEQAALFTWDTTAENTLRAFEELTGDVRQRDTTDALGSAR